ncbi:hypothetical protein Hypma_003696 [Hypsizygus marmoreus]|uniref:CCHC-type domain-containing protein n=1 Tax=Hypsizygus marmoreus TaxID=39966 RepID=A0A369J575_HYPMA|nr:hypothetical protein Hypma_003696 [Hypsizygus marmoreus]
MSTYNLRRRDATANVPGESSPPLANAVTPHTEAAERPPLAQAATRLYSDVAASRTPSPPLGRQEEDGSTAGGIPTGTSVPGNREESDLAPSNKNNGHDPIFQAAENSLTPEQREQIRNRFVHIQPRETTTESREEGPTEPKGKGPDPGNWGAAGLEDPAETNVDVQREHLEYYNSDKPKAGRSKKKRTSHKRAQPEEERSTPMSDLMAQRLDSLAKGRDIARKMNGRAARSLLDPVNQIASKSYLGHALRNTARGFDDESDSPDGSSSDSSSTPSWPSDTTEYGGSNSDSTSSESGRRPSHRRRSKRHSSHRKQKTLIKPVPPKEYDGSADSRLYHRFVTEGTAYVKDGKVKSNRQVFILSYYLKGKAYDFYTRKVSASVSQWSLREFFGEMFNYCFPIDYRIKQREKLRRCFQNDKSVSEYVDELEELYTMIGVSNEREKVVKLWNGLRTEIQKALWRERLNPELSTWEQVSDTAQIIEISEKVSSGRDNRPDRNRNQGGSGDNRSQGSRDPRRNHRPRDNRPPSNKPENGEHRNNYRGTGPSQPRHDATREQRDQRGRSQLTEKERNELLTVGKCFKCKEAGHMARQCPKGNFVKSDRSGRAPGMTNFSIGIDAANSEYLQELSETTEMLHDIPVGVISFDLDEHPELRCMTFARRDLGDLAADVAARQLQAAQPYPGDDWDVPDEEKYIRIEKEFLFTEAFNLPLWYAIHISERLELDDVDLPWTYWLDFEMGDVLAHV